MAAAAAAAACIATARGRWAPAWSMRQALLELAQRGATMGVGHFVHRLSCGIHSLVARGARGGAVTHSGSGGTALPRRSSRPCCLLAAEKMLPAINSGSILRKEITAYVFILLPRRVTMLEDAVIYSVSTSTDAHGGESIGARTRLRIYTHRTERRRGSARRQTHTHPHTTCTRDLHAIRT